MEGHVSSSTYTWGGVKPLRFGAGGKLSTPWGEGTWAPVKGQPDSIFATFVGTRHLVTFQDVRGAPGAMFISQRCSDGDIVMGRAVRE